MADGQEATSVQLILCSGGKWQLIMIKDGSEKPHLECSVGPHNTHASPPGADVSKVDGIFSPPLVSPKVAAAIHG